jgi:hypothetical protein
VKRFSASGKRFVRKPWRRARLSFALPFLLAGLAAVSAVKTAYGVLGGEPASVAVVDGLPALANGQSIPEESSERSSEPSSESPSVAVLRKGGLSKAGAGETPVAAYGFGTAESNVELRAASPTKRWWPVLALALPVFRLLDEPPALAPPLPSDLPDLLHLPVAATPSAPRAPPRRI